MRKVSGKIFARGIRAALAAAFAACITVSATGCGKRETPAETAARNGILLVGNAADPASLDPSLATGSSEIRILRGLFEGLVRADTKTLEVRPAAAKSWTVSDDGLTYRFKIDKNAKWSDGSPVSARDFEYAWKRALNPALGAEYASMLHAIKNARPYNAGEIGDASKVGVRAISDSELEVELERPVPYFESMLYHSAFFPLPRKTLEKFGATDRRDTRWTRPENMVCNGPFTLVKWSINDKISLRANPHYRARESLKLKGADFFPISNINTEDRAFSAGQLHITDSVAPPRLPAALAAAPQTVRRDRWLGVYYYLFNTRRPPLDDPRVRRALSLSIDRRAIIDSFLKAGQDAAGNFVPSGCGGYVPPRGESENIALAKKLLAEAGYPDGKNFPRIRISYNTSEQHKPIAESVQQMWRKNLGINAELFNLSWPAYLAARREGDFDVARSSWVGDFDAPENFLDLFHSASGLNHSGYKSAEYDALLTRARSAKTRPERMRLLAEAEAKMLADAPVMPIYFYSRVFRISPLVRGWDANALDYHNFLGVSLEAKGEAK